MESWVNSRISTHPALVPESGFRHCSINTVFAASIFDAPEVSPISLTAWLTSGLYFAGTSFNVAIATVHEAVDPGCGT